MIHDCGSFIFEYLYFKKAVMFLVTKNNTKVEYTKLALDSLKSVMIGKNALDIEAFINNVVDEKVDYSSSISFYERNLRCANLQVKPSDHILNTIKRRIK